MRLAPLLIALVLAPLSACTTVERIFSNDPLPLFDVNRENAEEYVRVAEEEIARGELPRAIERLIAVRQVANLQPETRLRSEGMIDRAASLLLADASNDLDALEALWEADLSPRMRARAGVRYAEALYEAGNRVTAYKQIRALELELPSHPEGAAAGAVLARTGLDLIEDPGRYYLVLRYATRGAAALELLVLTYPLDPSCPEAYGALARHYERRDELELAIARNEDLIYYHPRSPEAVFAEAEIPRLRLALIDAADHDRGELLRALEESRAWLRRHGDTEYAPTVRALELNCQRGLAISDLVLARYYDRIGNSGGARMHAERARNEAGVSGSDDITAAAEELLQALGTDAGAMIPSLEAAPR